ncbi:MAG: uracil-DNA glycosylase [Erysipelotrichaceae bacterium]
MINKTWDEFLNNEFKQDYFQKLSAFLKNQYQTETIYPAKTDVFNAFLYTDLDKVKVVILGQDPYYQPNQAMGLAFSVNRNVPLPASLKNIYQEISSELNVKMSDNGCLIKWASQGVMLLNTVLTVKKGCPNSHKNKGWEIFTDHVIEHLDKQPQPIVFMLWGNNAKSKQQLLHNPNHLVLTSVHPSPLSAYEGFFGCQHFVLANQFLKEQGLSQIDWRI